VSAEPQPHDDERRDERHDEAMPPPPSPPGGVVSACPLCDAPVPATDLRCPRCNMTLAGIDGRPGPFSRTVLFVWAAALVVIYLAVLAVVALIPA
jgi:hypothetical protein